ARLPLHAAIPACGGACRAADSHAPAAAVRGEAAETRRLHGGDLRSALRLLAEPGTAITGITTYLSLLATSLDSASGLRHTQHEEDQEELHGYTQSRRERTRRVAHLARLHGHERFLRRRERSAIDRCDSSRARSRCHVARYGRYVWRRPQRGARRPRDSRPAGHRRARDEVR